MGDEGRRMAGEEGNVEGVGGLGEAGAAPLQPGFLAGPATVKGVELFPIGEAEQLVPFPGGKVATGHLPVRQIIPPLFQVDPHVAADSHGQEAEAAAVGDVEAKRPATGQTGLALLARFKPERRRIPVQITGDGITEKTPSRDELFTCPSVTEAVSPRHLVR